MRTLMLMCFLLVSCKLGAQIEQSNSYFRHAPLGALAGTAGTIIGTTLGGGDKAAGIAGGAMFSIASSLLVRGRTDAVTSLVTTGAGFVCTAALTISLNKKKKKIKTKCFKF